MPNFAIDCVPGVAAMVVIVSGEVDLLTAPWLDEQLYRCRQAGASVIVDLQQVDFIDCSGLRVLVRASEKFGPGRFSVTPGSPQVQKLFELTGVSAHLKVVPHVPRIDQNAA